MGQLIYWWFIGSADHDLDCIIIRLIRKLGGVKCTGIYKLIRDCFLVKRRNFDSEFNSG